MRSISARNCSRRVRFFFKAYSALAKLRTGDIDLVVGLLPNRPLGVEFGNERLYEDPIVTVVRRGHPLTTQRSPGWAALADYPLVLPPASIYTRGCPVHRLDRTSPLSPRRASRAATASGAEALRHSGAERRGPGPSGREPGHTSAHQRAVSTPAS